MERVIKASEDDLMAQLDKHESVEDIVTEISPAGQATEIIVQIKLRRVLLLQDGTDSRQQNIVCAQITSLKDHQRQKVNWFNRVKSGAHPSTLLIGAETRHGTSSKEALVNMQNITPIPKKAILKKKGFLLEKEMQLASSKLITTLELDVSEYVRQLVSGSGT